jgi:hypothetical protein
MLPGRTDEVDLTARLAHRRPIGDVHHVLRNRCLISFALLCAALSCGYGVDAEKAPLFSDLWLGFRCCLNVDPT